MNGHSFRVAVEPDTPLLWVLREQLGLTGTKYGCGIGVCGSCSVHIDGDLTLSCQLPISRAVGHKITTIEGLAEDPTHPVLRAWLEKQVPQCGYCQPGQIMAAAALLNKNNEPSDEDISVGMNGNICRCGTYPRIRRAIHRAVELWNVR